MNLENKTVLVTGAEGFIGSHLVEQLLARDCRVKAMALYNFQGSYGWLQQIPSDDRLELFLGDVRDIGSVNKAMEGIDVVFHLAALIGIPYSYVAPESYVSTNVVGTHNVLQAVRNGGVERTVITSTSEVYGTARYIPIDEEHPVQAQSPYSASKIGADRLAESYYRSFGTPVTTVRPFNTFGPRQSTRAVIPTIITQLLSGQDTIRLGALSPTRDFVFVEDTAEGFCRLAECDDAIGEETNIATGSDISIRELAEMLIERIRPETRVVEESSRKRPPNSEVERLLGSSKKLDRLTGWAPTTEFAQGLDKTIAWFGENRSRHIESQRYTV